MRSAMMMGRGRLCRLLQSAESAPLLEGARVAPVVVVSAVAGTGLTKILTISLYELIHTFQQYVFENSFFFQYEDSTLISSTSTVHGNDRGRLTFKGREGGTKMIEIRFLS